MQTQSSSVNDHYDVIVVGAGVGGCIAVARIAQFGVNPLNGEKLKVALFEWGPYHKGDPRRGYGIPSRRAAFDGLPYELAQRYRLPWGTLGMVGGSAQWAGMIAFPPTPIDFEHWRAETGVDWTWENFNLPLMEVNEMWHPFPDATGLHSPGQLRFRDAGLATGYPVRQSGQAKMNCPRCGECNGRVCEYDAKSTPLVTYVPIAEREGVQIFGQTPVEKILIEKKWGRPVATGIVYRQDGRLRQATAGKVIVSCGYSGTPRLLYRSGYGPREKVHGELLAENRNVGANLVSSINARGVDILFDEPIAHEDIGVQPVYYVPQADTSGRNLLMISESLGTLSFPEELAISPIAPEFGREHKAYMKTSTTRVGRVKIEVAKNAVRGEINLEGGSIFGGHEAEGGRGGARREFLEREHPDVLETLREGQQMARKIIDYLNPAKATGLEGFPDVLSTNHHHGTCRAGATREVSVVNSDLESHDVDNLFIFDASVVPFQCTATPSMPTAAVCSYAWRRMIANHFLPAELEKA